MLTAYTQRWVTSICFESDIRQFLGFADMPIVQQPQYDTPMQDMSHCDRKLVMAKLRQFTSEPFRFLPFV